MTVKRSSGRTSRNKGKRGEREAAAALTEALGVPFARGLSQSRGAEEPDLRPVDGELARQIRAAGFHFEAKFYATSQMSCDAMLETWAAQMVQDAPQATVRILLHRWNGHRGWWVWLHRAGHVAAWYRLHDIAPTLRAELGL